VLGGGSWGTALAWLLGEKGVPVRLWCRSEERAREITETRRSERYAPGLQLPKCITPTADLPSGLAGAGVVVVAVPAQAVREALSTAAGCLHPAATLVLAAKGLERDTARRLSQVAGEAAPGHPVAVLSGPNLAGEIVRRIPTATVVGCEDAGIARELQGLFATSTFRVYANRDIAGVELGGALKNPIALAAGISDGLGFGNNTKASLLTRGLAEITRLGVAAGGLPGTFAGLSGLGDLVATAGSPLSRNYSLGLALGRGETLEAALAALGHVAEGVPTTEAACRLAQSLEVDAPIISELRRVLFQDRPAREAVYELMTRPYRDEEHL
jgi:glycerol-3-phosphate dehydrogenase (NAD(P)+)